MVTLILGGARSGKSRFAQSQFSPTASVVYIATARVDDAELRARVERHRADRPAAWRTVEEPVALAAAIHRASLEVDLILVDCLTVWLSNLFWEHRDLPSAEFEAIAFAEVDAIAAIAARGCHIVLVSNEVGGGIVPEHPLARRFRDLQGLVNQRAAALADRVYLTVAGIPLRIKPSVELECAR